MEATNGPKWRSWINEGWRSYATSVDFTSGEVMPHQLVDVLKGTMADVSKPDTGIEAVTGAKNEFIKPIHSENDNDGDIGIRFRAQKNFRLWKDGKVIRCHPTSSTSTNYTANESYSPWLRQQANKDHESDSMQTRPASLTLGKQDPRVWHFSKQQLPTPLPPKKGKKRKKLKTIHKFDITSQGRKYVFLVGLVYYVSNSWARLA